VDALAGSFEGGGPSDVGIAPDRFVTGLTTVYAPKLDAPVFVAVLVAQVPNTNGMFDRRQ